MSLGSLIKFGIVLWLVVESLVFVLVARLIGFPEALILAFLTSLFGWTRLRQAGAAAMVKLRAAVNGRRIVAPDERNVLDATIASIGALALLLPGFVSDLVGLGLMVPAARGWIARLIKDRRLASVLGGKAPAARQARATIDLEPGDWERSAPSRQPASRY